MYLINENILLSEQYICLLNYSLIKVNIIFPFFK